MVQSDHLVNKKNGETKFSKVQLNAVLVTLNTSKQILFQKKDLTSLQNITIMKASGKTKKLSSRMILRLQTNDLSI